MIGFVFAGLAYCTDVTTYTTVKVATDRLDSLTGKRTRKGVLGRKEFRRLLAAILAEHRR